jgi:hypothetical protein
MFHQRGEENVTLSPVRSLTHPEAPQTRARSAGRIERTPAGKAHAAGHTSADRPARGSVTSGAASCQEGELQEHPSHPATLPPFYNPSSRGCVTCAIRAW